MDKKDERQLERLYSALKVLFVMDQDLKLGQVLAFLSVAIKEGQYVAEIEKRVGLGQSTASRYLTDLSAWSSKRVGGKRLPGMGLVEEREDYNDSRSVRKQYPSRKGINTIENILLKLNGPIKEEE